MLDARYRAGDRRRRHIQLFGSAQRTLVFGGGGKIHEVPQRQPRDAGFALGFGCAYKISAESLSERLNHVSHRHILG
jgi:hypothetical protein